MGTNPATSFGAGADPRGEIAASPYFNPDLAPTSTAQRTWRLRDIAALWISMSACVPTYMLASSLIDEGMNWWQAVLTIFLGNIIVLVPMVLNAPRRHQVRHPVSRLLPGRRSAFAAPTSRRCSAPSSPAAGSASRRGSAAGPSTRSSQVYLPSWKGLPVHSDFGINLPQLALLPRSSGPSTCSSSTAASTRSACCSNIKAPLLIVLGLALLAWAYQEAGGFGPMLSQPSQFEPGGPKAGAVLARSSSRR